MKIVSDASFEPVALETVGSTAMMVSICSSHIVVTPGRLKDHIENTARFATRLMGVKVLVLD